MQYVSHLLPPSYLFTGMRAAIFGDSVSLFAVLVPAFALDIAYIFLSYALFAHVYRVAIRKGLIARFGAETP